MELHLAERRDYPLVKELYARAFPKEERAPWFLLHRRAKQGRGELLIARENGQFLGFAYMVCYGNLAYLFYFAIAEDCRGSGWGSQILQQLIAHYPDKTLVLAREPLDDNAENAAQRVRRRNFYLRNGLSDIPYQIQEATVIYDLMSPDPDLNPKDYDDLMCHWAGWLQSRRVPMRLIAK